MAQDLTVKKTTQTKQSKEETRKLIERMRTKDSEMVRGIFRFHEVPGATLSFVYKAYPGDDVERYDLVDGQVHTIPFGVAKHLNNRCDYPEYEYFKDESTHNTMRVSKRVRRTSFQSLEFIDDADFNNAPTNIVSVEKAVTL